MINLYITFLEPIWRYGQQKPLLNQLSEWFQKTTRYKMGKGQLDLKFHTIWIGWILAEKTWNYIFSCNVFKVSEFITYTN